MNKEKPLIMAIVGPSGAGKTEMANLIEGQYGIKMIESYTDRPPRYEGETGHTFVTPEQMDKVIQKPLIAYTEFGAYRYCCTQEDVEMENTYVIDERGLEMMIRDHSDKYLIHNVFIERPLEERIKVADTDRVKRDKNRFNLGYQFYDDVIFNITTREDFHKKIIQVTDSVLARYDRL